MSACKLAFGCCRYLTRETEHHSPSPKQPKGHGSGHQTPSTTPKNTQGPMTPDPEPAGKCRNGSPQAGEAYWGTWKWKSPGPTCPTASPAHSHRVPLIQDLPWPTTWNSKNTREARHTEKMLVYVRPNWSIIRPCVVCSVYNLVFYELKVGNLGNFEGIVTNLYQKIRI